VRAIQHGLSRILLRLENKVINSTERVVMKAREVKAEYCAFTIHDASNSRDHKYTQPMKIIPPQNQTINQTIPKHGNEFSNFFSPLSSAGITFI